MKKKRTVPMVLVALALLLMLGAGAQTPQRETLMGEVIDLVSYAMRGAQGEEAADAMKYRVEGGFPVGILADDGTVYIAVYRDPAPAAPLETANKILLPLVGKEVVCQGRLFERDGVHLVEIAVVAEM